MSTTPRTDAIEERTGTVLCGSANLGFARTLERELAAAKAEAAHYMSVAQKATAELAAEREKMRVLREALERRHDEQSYYCQYVEDALAATKEDSR